MFQNFLRRAAAKVHEGIERGASSLRTEYELILLSVKAEFKRDIPNGLLQYGTAALQHRRSIVLVSVDCRPEFCLNFKKCVPGFCRSLPEIFLKARKGKTLPAVFYVVAHFLVFRMQREGALKVAKRKPVLVEVIISERHQPVMPKIFRLRLFVHCQDSERLMIELCSLGLRKCEIGLRELCIPLGAALLGGNCLQHLPALLKRAALVPLPALFQNIHALSSSFAFRLLPKRSIALAHCKGLRKPILHYSENSPSTMPFK